jgi:hypothetical protein
MPCPIVDIDRERSQRIIQYCQMQKLLSPAMALLSTEVEICISQELSAPFERLLHSEALSIESQPYRSPSEKTYPPAPSIFRAAPDAEQLPISPKSLYTAPVKHRERPGF